jgi:transposase-like protein
LDDARSRHCPEHPVNQRAIKAFKPYIRRARTTRNNLIEQDHRGVKQRIAVMLGFKGFRHAAITIAGIELMHRIRKGQFGLGHLDVQGRTASAVWNAVLRA